MPIITVTPSCSRQLQSVADSVARSKKIIVVTGAGISTNCGIPDFRSTDGLYNLVKAQYPNAVVKGRDLFDAVLWSDPTSTSLFYTFLANLRSEVLKVKETTSVHKFIRTLAETGRLQRCYTQNIDGLEEREGLVMNLSHGKGKRKRPSPITVDDNRTDQEKGCQVVQLHGNLKSLRCTNCQMLTTYTPSAVRTLLSGVAPLCEACQIASECRQAAGKRGIKVGHLRPNVVLYGEEHPDAEMVGILAEADIKAAPDLMIILGTSLKVHGLKVVVKEFSKAVHAKGGKVLFVNNTPPTDSVWSDVIDYFVEMDCDVWVADVKARRAAIWERQTKLPVQKLTKAGAVAEKKAPLRDKENAGAKKRKILEPKTPGGRSRKALGMNSTLQQTPPSSRKRDSKKHNILCIPPTDSEPDAHRTPTKRRKITKKFIIESPPISPPSTPTVKGGRALRIEVIVSGPEKQLRNEIQIYEDNDGSNVTAWSGNAGYRKSEPNPKPGKSQEAITRRKSLRNLKSDMVTAA
ncbi:DHS-like NAD/FAD-binding domain-containing protein [Trichophaea hybrida]|nr:DHS-like NAD/FAD-binding domain-containing protein [Trichophaea hybrida]